MRFKKEKKGFHSSSLSISSNISLHLTVDQIWKIDFLQKGLLTSSLTVEKSEMILTPHLLIWPSFSFLWIPEVHLSTVFWYFKIVCAGHLTVPFNLEMHPVIPRNILQSVFDDYFSPVYYSGFFFPG